MAQRAASLGRKPSSFFCVCFLFSFLLLLEQKAVFLLKRPLLLICQYLPLFLPSFFPSPFHSLFLFLALVLLFVPSFFYFFVVLFCLLVFLSSIVAFFICFCFTQRTTSKISNLDVCFIKNVCVLLSVLFFFQLPFSYLCLPPDFMMCFVQHQCLRLKKDKLKHTNFWSRGGLQQNGSSNNLCFAKCAKLSFFGAHFWANFG